MKKIYILLMHTNTMPARLIKTITRYEYSHVAISLDESCETLYSFGRRRWNSVLDAGFSVETKTGEFFKYFNKTKCKIYEVEITDEQYDAVLDIIKYMENNEHTFKYDFCGIVIRFFNIPITFKNRYVCSYFVADVLQKAKVHKFNKKACLIKPKDFDGIKGFNEIYKGSYLKYSKRKAI